MENKIGICILCYNVEHSIREVLHSFSPAILSEVTEIVAIDNCSQDRTRILLNEAKNLNDTLGQKLVIIENKQNYGLGGSQKIVYQYFLENGFTHFMLVHGDGQGDGDTIARNFLKVFYQQPDIDVILTSRFMTGGSISSYDRWRTLGNRVFNFITWFCSGHWMSDAGAAIIFYRTKILKRVSFADLTNSFQFNPELNILLMNLPDIKVKEIPLQWKDSKDPSNIIPIRYCWDLLLILLRYSFKVRLLKKQPELAFHGTSQRIQMTYRIMTVAGMTIQRSIIEN